MINEIINSNSGILASLHHSSAKSQAQPLLTPLKLYSNVIDHWVTTGKSLIGLYAMHCVIGTDMCKVVGNASRAIHISTL